MNTVGAIDTAKILWHSPTRIEGSILHVLESVQRKYTRSLMPP